MKPKPETVDCTLSGSEVKAVQTRVELFSVELQKETRRLSQLIVCAGALVAVGTIGLMLFILTIIFAFWETAPLQALDGLTVLYLAGAALLYPKITSALKRGRWSFSNTIAENQARPQLFGHGWGPRLHEERGLSGVVSRHYLTRYGARQR